MDIHNHYRLTDSIASSGQPLEDQFKEIAEAGYEAVINLAMPDKCDTHRRQHRDLLGYGSI